MRLLTWSAFGTSLATAIAAAQPQQDVLVKAIADAVKESKTDPTVLANAVATGVTSGRNKPALPSAHLFNVNRLDRDVRERYQDRQQNKLIVGSVVKTRYSTGYYYYSDPPGSGERLFLADGTLFLVQSEPNEKGLLRDPVVCKNTTHQGLRSWYNTFVRHAMDHGFYVHPLYCFRKDHGGDWGFSIGDGIDDDLPTRLRISVQAMTQPLYRLLQKSDMFPRDSNCVNIVQQCFGDGYKALKQLMFLSHPVFHPQPATLIMSYPKQRDRNMLEYYSLFQDYLQLRAYITDQDSSLDSTHEMDVFINNTRHSQWLNRVTRDERKTATLAYKYTAAQVVETLNTFLNEPDSPANDERRTALSTTYRQPPPGNNASSTTRRQPSMRNRRQGDRRVPINPILVDGDDTPDLSLTDSDDSYQSLYSELRDMDVPDAPDARFTHAAFTAMINRVQSQPLDANAPMQCIVCGQNHRFDSCEVLKDTDFLKSHYIRFCQQLRREASARAASFRGPAGNLPAPSTSSVNFLDTQENDHDAVENLDEAETSSEADEDFQTGRR